MEKDGFRVFIFVVFGMAVLLTLGDISVALGNPEYYAIINIVLSCLMAGMITWVDSK